MAADDPTLPPDAATPSVSPRSVTWPVVAMQLVKETPAIALVVSGAVVAIVFILHSPASEVEPLMSVFMGGSLAVIRGKQKDPS